jgi:hypothetical protein
VRAATAHASRNLPEKRLHAAATLPMRHKGWAFDWHAEKATLTCAIVSQSIEGGDTENGNLEWSDRNSWRDVGHCYERIRQR